MAGYCETLWSDRFILHSPWRVGPDTQVASVISNIVIFTTPYSRIFCCPAVLASCSTSSFLQKVPVGDICAASRCPAAYCVSTWLSSVGCILRSDSFYLHFPRFPAFQKIGLIGLSNLSGSLWGMKRERKRRIRNPFRRNVRVTVAIPLGVSPSRMLRRDCAAVCSRFSPGNTYAVLTQADHPYRRWSPRCCHTDSRQCCMALCKFSGREVVGPGMTSWCTGKAFVFWVFALASE